MTNNNEKSELETAEVATQPRAISDPDLMQLQLEYLHEKRWGHARSYDKGKVQCNECGGWNAPAMLDRLGMCGMCSRQFNE